MRTDRNTTKPRSDRQAGLTIVELSIAAVLVVAIVGLTHSSTIAVHSATRYSEARLAQESSSREVLATLKRELRESSLEKDPKTNQYRYTISTNKWLKQQLSFRKLESASIVGTEVEPVWSSNVTISVNDKNEVTREQDGTSRILAVGIKQLYFETTLSGKFKVTAVTARPNKKTGKTMDVHETLYIRPKN